MCSFSSYRGKLCHKGSYDFSCLFEIFSVHVVECRQFGAVNVYLTYYYTF